MCKDFHSWERCMNSKVIVYILKESHIPNHCLKQGKLPIFHIMHESDITKCSQIRGQVNFVDKC